MAHTAETTSETRWVVTFARMRPPWYWGRRPLRIPALLAGAASARPTVVYLVRAANGPQALRVFTEAVRRHDPGIEYELVLAMKGFATREQATPYLEEAADLAPEALFFPDVGFDLGVFFAVAARLRRTRYCFMNSWAHPVADGWLAKLNGALERPGVGVVGANGSWASIHSWLTWRLGLPSAYHRFLPPRREGHRQMLQMERELRDGVPEEGRGRFRERLGMLAQVPEMLLDFEPFPNPHLRTASFMISHAVLSQLELFVITNNKTVAYALEAGPQSITRQVERLGLCVLVVDRDGSVYGPQAWPESMTFRQGDQEGLLVADRRTLEYERGDMAQRRLMAATSWGPSADPPTLATEARSPGGGPTSSQRM